MESDPIEIAEAASKQQILMRAGLKMSPDPQCWEKL